MTDRRCVVGDSSDFGGYWRRQAAGHRTLAEAADARGAWEIAAVDRYRAQECDILARLADAEKETSHG